MSLYNKYQLIEKISNGSRYNLDRVISRLEQNSVLVKTINPQFKAVETTAWLQNEYEILAELNLIGVLNPHRIEKIQDRETLILEDFAGQNLVQFLNSQKLTLGDFLNIAVQLATIIQELNHEQIIHQNLQPSSILIAPETLVVKITDFTLATKIVQVDNVTPKPLEVLNIAYISPEQTGRLNLPLDYRSDFYSLGIILYQMLTGVLPFEASHSLELIHCHLAKKPIPPHQISSDIFETVSQIVMKLLAKNPDDRYQTAEGIKADLAKCQIHYLEQGVIELFELGNLDRLSQFTISKKLYGRSSAMEAIALGFERVSSGISELILIEGDLGIGKTSLVCEVGRQLSQQKGNFTVGTFQLNQDIPYQAIVKAFQTLIKSFLGETKDLLQYWQQKILAAVGKNGKVIIDILPELELVIGSQLDIPELPAKETQNRFNNVFVKFAQVFSEPESPLILFFDDLQWADSASLDLITLLQKDLNSKYLLVIGAYCGCEIDSQHPLFQTISRNKSTKTVESMTLQPLTLHEVNSLLVDTFHCLETKSFSLAQFLVERTSGNPFFISQLLQTLYIEKLLSFNFENLNWQWCIEEILTTSITNYDVLELVCQKIEKLPDTTQQILKLAACIGDEFELTILTDIWNTVPKSEINLPANFDPKSIARELKYALQVGIIIFADQKSNSSYQFLHNRVHQTTYSLLGEADAAKIHLRIGQYLLQNKTSTEIEEQIFNLVHHFNLGRTQLATELWQYRLLKLNLIAAKKAQVASAYQAAANYLDIALELLSPSDWKNHYQLALKTNLAASEVQYLQTNFIRAAQLGNIVLTQAKTVLEKIQVYKIKIHAHIAQNDMQLAIDLGFYVLELLKVSIPHNQQHTQDLPPNLDLHHLYTVEFLSSLPPLTDSSGLAVMEILTLILPPIYITNPQVFPYVTCRMVDLCVQYGNSSFSAYVYAVYGLLLCAVGDIDSGYQFGRLAVAIQEQYAAIKIKSRVSFIVTTMILHWCRPTASILEDFLQGIKSGLDVGDIEHACFHAKYYCTYLFFAGESLISANEKSLIQINLINYYKQDFQLNYARLWRQLNLNLQGLAQNNLLLIGNSFDESQLLPVWQKTNNATSLFAYYLAKLILSYLLQDYSQAVVYGSQGKQYLDAAVGTMCFSVYHFYNSLAMLAVCPDNSEFDKSMLPEILSSQKQMEQWANHAPDNYLHKYELITAEIAKLTQDNEQAAEYYDRAITHAEQAGYLSEVALAAELAGKFYLARRRNRIAGFYLADAYRGYKQWGAKAKLQNMESEYPTLLNRYSSQDITRAKVDAAETTTEFGCETSTLDLFSVIKASQAISSEIILDNLLSYMIEIVMENAGAQTGILLLEQNSNWVVAASGVMTIDNQIMLPYVPITEYKDIPSSLINYIQNSRDTIILDDATRDGMFINDPYIIEHQPQSILCCPMIYQHKLQGIIYLENRFVRGAFTPQKLNVLQFLLSQVSISIENAQLYKNLEDHASVQKSLEQKEILLKEIHHRVKNNLFVVSSLLEFQSSYLEDSEVIKHLKNCQNRIASMALVHQHLYGHSELNKIDFAQYTQSLLDNLTYSQGSKERNINLILDLDPIELNIESANPCGLIVNELISNALEHGFRDRSQGNIWLSLKRNLEQQVVLTIADDGIGFGEDLDLHNSDSLGLELVLTLVEQLDGEITLDKTQGTKIELVFDELDYQNRI
ncbi:MAG: AAA family ATPase [Cyanobacteria bacterium P01_G01_bin.67]